MIRYALSLALTLQKMEIYDPSPHNKRDVIVYFYDKDAFCNALRKNGSQMLSYTFDALYNPYPPLSLPLSLRNLHRPLPRDSRAIHRGQGGNGGGGGGGGRRGKAPGGRIRGGGHHMDRPRTNGDVRKV